jgi:hypothetical protein
MKNFSSHTLLHKYMVLNFFDTEVDKIQSEYLSIYVALLFSLMVLNPS